MLSWQCFNGKHWRGYCFWGVDAEILKALDDWIALLAAKEYENFHDSASARSDPFSTSESGKRVLDELLPTLRATKRLVPR